MAEKNSTTQQTHQIAGDRLIELASRKASPEKKEDPKEGPVEVPAQAALQKPAQPRASLFQKLGKLKPLLPVLSGGLRMVDHGAIQALAQILNFVDGSGSTQSAVQEDVQHGLLEIQSAHRELQLHVQDQTVGMRRLEDQIVQLRQTVERNAVEHNELTEDVKSLGNLVRNIGAGLAILLIILIVLVSLSFTHHG